MSALYDDDDEAREAEMIAQAWVKWRAYVKEHVREHRECLVAIATCQQASPPEDDTAACQALDALIASYTAEDLNLLIEMLGIVLWDGVRSAEREARTRLMALTNAVYIDPQHGLIGAKEMQP